MTKKQIVTQLILIYTKCIEEIKESNSSDLIDIVKKHHTYEGICKCSRMKINENIYREEWVKEKTKADGFWFETPLHIYAHREIMPKILRVVLNPIFKRRILRKCLYPRLNTLLEILDEC